MSSSSQKRSRKSKLEPRMYAEYKDDVTLQHECAKRITPRRPKKHKPNATVTKPIQQPEVSLERTADVKTYTNKKKKIDVGSASMEFNINIEVEECDGDDAWWKELTNSTCDDSNANNEDWTIASDPNTEMDHLVIKQEPLDTTVTAGEADSNTAIVVKREPVDSNLDNNDNANDNNMNPNVRNELVNLSYVRHKSKPSDGNVKIVTNNAKVAASEEEIAKNTAEIKEDITRRRIRQLKDTISKKLSKAVKIVAKTYGLYKCIEVQKEYSEKPTRLGYIKTISLSERKFDSKYYSTSVNSCIDKLKRITKNPIGLECRFCHEAFKSNVDMIAHLNAEHTKRLLTVMTDGTSNGYKVTAVLKLGQPNLPGLNSMTYAGAMYKIITNHRYNNKRYKYSIIASYKCYRCQLQYLNYSQFYDHIKGMHLSKAQVPVTFYVEEGTPPFVNLTAAEVFDFKEQRFPMFLNNKPKVTCIYCRINFMAEEELEEHYSKSNVGLCDFLEPDTSNDPPQNVKFKLPILQQDCICPKSLQKNCRHACCTSKRWKCDSCDFSSYSSLAYNNHQTNWHLVRSDEMQYTDEKISWESTVPRLTTEYKPIYACYTCSSQFTTESQFYFHLRESETTKVKCLDCGESEFSVCKVPEHNLKHSSDKVAVYQCNLCVSFFKNKIAVKKHIAEAHPKALKTVYIDFGYRKVILKRSDVIIDNDVWVFVDPDSSIWVYNNQATLVNTKNEKIFNKILSNLTNESLANYHITRHSEPNGIHGGMLSTMNNIDDDDDIENDSGPEQDLANGDEEPLADIKPENDDASDDDVYTNIKKEFDVEENAFDTTLESAGNLEIDTSNNDVVQNQGIVIDSSGKITININPSVFYATAAEPVKIKEEIQIKEEMDELILQDVDENEAEEVDNFINNTEEIVLSCEEILEEPPSEIILNKKEKRIYTCLYCSHKGLHKNFQRHLVTCEKRQDALLKKRIGSAADNYPCSLCKKKFRKLKKYLGHLYSHGISITECPSCKEQTNSLSYLHMHVMSHLKTDFVKVSVIITDYSAKRAYQCIHCQKDLPAEEKFVHWESHLHKLDAKNRPKEEIMDGEVAAAGLSQETIEYLTNKLQRHIRKHYLLDRFCKICEKSFNRVTDLKRHAIEHLTSDAKTKKIFYGAYKCQICSADFKKVDKFKRHMRIHGCLPVYQCALCDKTFNDSSNFAKHKKVHNFNVHICDLCGKKYQSKKSLISHIELHGNSEKISCEFCPREFYFQTQYKKHLKMKHFHNMNGYGCMICTKRFVSLKDKWDHEWEVHKERKVIADCSLCNERFRKYSELKTHLKKAHTINDLSCLAHLLQSVRRRSTDSSENEENIYICS